MSRSKTNKGMPLTKEEVMQLINLIEENPVVTTKATTASNNHLKEAAWLKITNSFNALISSCPRKPQQLRLKWDNLKKAARKRSSNIRVNNLRTGGGKPDFIPPDEALDKVSTILGPTCEGYSVTFGGDAVEMEYPELTNESVVVVPLEDNTNNDVQPQTPVHPCILSTPKKKFFVDSTKSTVKQQTNKIHVDETESRTRLNNAIAEYYKVKRIKLEEDINKDKIKLELEKLLVKKVKLELEILELSKQKL